MTQPFAILFTQYLRRDLKGKSLVCGFSEVDFSVLDKERIVFGVHIFRYRCLYFCRERQNNIFKAPVAKRSVVTRNGKIRKNCSCNIPKSTGHFDIGKVFVFGRNIRTAIDFKSLVNTFLNINDIPISVIGFYQSDLPFRENNAITV